VTPIDLEDTPSPVARVVTVLKRVSAKVAESRLLQRWWRELFVVVGLAMTIAAPFALKPADGSVSDNYDRRLVIITPHNDKIRYEFGAAFSRYWKQRTGETLYVDWRAPGGTADIAMYLRSEFAAAFGYYWTRQTAEPWTFEVETAFSNGKLDMKPDASGTLTDGQQARRAFLDSDVGVGIDLFFGGGAYDFQTQTSAGYLVSSNSIGHHGLKAVFAQHPEWFTDAVISQSVGGEPYYDKAQVWAGSCLSSMGICFNRDVLHRLGIKEEPKQWQDLADPRYMKQLALSDPNKSGTVTKAFEQLIQQQMQIEIDRLQQKPSAFKSEADMVKAGVNLGWTKGLQLIQRICANARYFSDFATKIPLDVAKGDAAAGMCIDFYGRSFEEEVRRADGFTRVGFITPVGGTSVGVDPVAMFRGAPEPEAATAFMEFVLSPGGQRLWNNKVGTPGGPVKSALRRLPVRKDFYTPENRILMTDPGLQPYEVAEAFTYHPEWTGSLLNVIRFIVKVMAIEVHDEQKGAWQTLNRAGFPKRATEVFTDLSLINYPAALEIAADLRRGDKVAEVRRTRELTNLFRAQYNKARELARAGQ